MKKLFCMFTLFIITAFSAMCIYAGSWQLDDIGYWYKNDDGSYLKNQWFQDERGEWYYFNDAGYIAMNQWVGNYYLGPSGTMLINTITPDGYRVDMNGAWIPGIKVDIDNITFSLLCLDIKPSLTVYDNSINVNGALHYYNNTGYLGKLIGNLNRSYTIASDTKYYLEQAYKTTSELSKQEFADISNTYKSGVLIIKIENGVVKEAKLQVK